jgi:hypothetical protein
MTSIRKLERDFARADLAAVTGLLAQLGDEDAMSRYGLEARQHELEEEIARLDAMPDEPTAAAALFFGGRPVVGARGIESGFAAAAVGKFQDIVAKVLADDTGNLGQRGVVPGKSAATLHITNIVRGSFGFLLEEVNPQQTLIDSSLKVAVDETSRLMQAFAEPDEERYREAVEAIDSRVLGTAREFFELMRQDGATLRLLVGESEHSFGRDEVARAAERAMSTTVDDTEETIAGQLAGILPDAHQFEFQAIDRGTIRGPVSRDLAADQLMRLNRAWAGVPATARVKVRRVRRENNLVREGYTLVALESLAPRVGDV